MPRKSRSRNSRSSRSNQQGGRKGSSTGRNKKQAGGTTRGNQRLEESGT